MATSEIKDFTSGNLAKDLVSDSSLLHDFDSEIDTTALDQMLEGLPLSALMPGVLGSTATNQGLEYKEAGGYGFLQSKNFITGTTGWQIRSDGNAEFYSLTVTGGTMKYGKTSFTDSTNAGWFFSPLGMYIGAVSDATKLKYTIADGTLDFVGTHSGGSVGGVSVTNVGYVATPTADIVPTGLTASTTGTTVGGDGTVSAYVTLTWTAISSNTFDHYLVRFKKASYTYYNYLPATTNTITIDGLVPNVSYNFGISSVNKYGAQSAFSSDISQTTAADTTAPATVTSGSATAGIQYVIVEWTHNTDTDLASYNIYRNTANDSATATLIGNCRTNYFIDGGRTGGQIYYYWVKAVDTSGNVSASFSTVQSATPRNVNSADTNVSNQGWTQTCVFSVTDSDTVAWAAGVFTTASGTSYSISGGNTGNMVARTFIYLDIAVSTTAYQITTTATSAVGDGKVLIAVAENNTTEAIFQVFGGVGGANWKGTDIVAGSVTTSEIAANTIVAGNIASGTITATQIDTTSITSLSNLSLAASQVLIDGAVYLTNWRHSSDLTKIDGGDIYANSVTTSQLNFTPVQSTNVIASINASAEGITIDADNITISGSTTFASGYDPSVALSTAQAKAKVFTAEPTTPYYVNDLWTDGTFLKKCGTQRLTGAYQAGDWIYATGYTDDTVANTKIKTFAQDAIPTSVSAGDMWIDTNDENKLYRAAIAGADQITAGEWVLYRDSGIATAIQDAADAQSTADGKIVTFAQDSIPTSTDVGDLWIDTNDGNKVYRAASIGADEIKAGEWIPFRDTTIADAQATADGKIVSFYQTTVPTAEGAGDLWFDTDDGNKCYRATAAGDDQITAGEWVVVPDQNKLGGTGSSAIGGSYATTSSGARVLIFPDANTGIQIIDDATNDVFKALVGGTNVGDVTIGNYSGGQGIFYDKSANTTTFAGTLSAPSGTLGTITAGTISGTINDYRQTFTAGENLTALKAAAMNFEAATGAHTYTSLEDTYINGASVGTNYSTNASLIAGYGPTNPNDDLRILFKHDTSAIPSTSVIYKIVFTLYLELPTTADQLTLSTLDTAPDISTVTYTGRPNPILRSTISITDPNTTGSRTFTFENLNLTQADVANGLQLGMTGTVTSAKTIQFQSADGSPNDPQITFYTLDNGSMPNSLAYHGQDSAIRSLLLGMVGASNINSTASGDITVLGKKSGLSSLTVGSNYYLGGTAGTLTTNPGTTLVGTALSATELLLRSTGRIKVHDVNQVYTTIPSTYMVAVGFKPRLILCFGRSENNKMSFGMYCNGSEYGVSMTTAGTIAAVGIWNNSTSGGGSRGSYANVSAIYTSHVAFTVASAAATPTINLIMVFIE